MPKIRKVLSLAGFLLVVLVCRAQVPTAESAPPTHSSANRGRPCLLSAEDGVVPDCIQQTAQGKLFISPQYVKKLDFDSHGLAPVRSESPHYDWMYVNREGAVVIAGVPTFDNWADDFSDGLVRTVVKGKYGFADRTGTIVIKPTYDWASPFDHGYAEACNHCREMCALPGRTVEVRSVPGGCDHRVTVGGEWFKIDKKGHIRAKLRR